MAWITALIVTAIIFGLFGWRFQKRVSDTFGSSGWCRVWTMFKTRLFSRGGLFVGDYAGRLAVRYNGAHALTIGAPGSGKGTSAIIPNLLDAKNIFLIDPGGENSAVAIRKWRADGKKIACLNIFDMFDGKPWALPGHGFNPLDMLDAASATFEADAEVIAEMLTARTGREIGADLYFTDQAQGFKKSLILHVMTTAPKAQRNLVSVYELVNGDQDAWDALLEAMKANSACGGEICKGALAIERIEAQSAGEFSAIRSTIQRNLKWISDRKVQEKLRRSDIDFSLLKNSKKGAVISVVLPLQYLQSHAAILRLATGCAMQALQRAPFANERVLFLIDECAALGKLQRFPNWLATLRKYNVGIWSIWQNIGQIIELYGKNWQTIISNCGLKQILSVGDLETAQYVENLLGKTTVKTVSIGPRGQVSTSYTMRPLMMADELLRLKSTKQIAFIDNLAPLLLKKTPYWKRPGNAGAFHPNPFLRGADSRAGALDHVMSIWGRMFYGLIWWLYPHPLAALVIVSPLVWFIVAVISAYLEQNGGGP